MPKNAPVDRGVIESGGDVEPSGEEGPPPPPTFSRQIAQLVLIPAAIVIAVISLSALFSVLVGTGSGDIESVLVRLESSSGMGKGPGGLKDPKYQERWRAAHNLATMAPTIKDPVEKAKISERLIGILTSKTNIGPDEGELRAFLIFSLGKLGQPSGYEHLIEELKTDNPDALEAAIKSLATLPEKSNDPANPDPPDKPTREKAKETIPRLVELLEHESAKPRYTAAWALGVMAEPGNEQVIGALRQARANADASDKTTKWESAIALAKLGDDSGVAFVTDFLLSREELSKLTVEEGPRRGEPVSAADQESLMLRMLGQIPESADERIWVKVQELKESDPSPTVKKKAKELLEARRQAAN